jgi:hypothetical protein
MLIDTLANCDISRAAALVTLTGNNLVVVRTQVHAERSPCIEVSSGVHAAAGAVALADGPVLLEGRGTLNGWLVSAGGLQDVVGSTIGGDRALQGRGGGGVV